jgi:hypothetical protein
MSDEPPCMSGPDEAGDPDPLLQHYRDELQRLGARHGHPVPSDYASLCPTSLDLARLALAEAEQEMEDAPAAGGHRS